MMFFGAGCTNLVKIKQGYSIHKKSRHLMGDGFSVLRGISLLRHIPDM